MISKIPQRHGALKTWSGRGRQPMYNVTMITTTDTKFGQENVTLTII